MSESIQFIVFIYGLIVIILAFHIDALRHRIERLEEELKRLKP